MLGLGDGWFWLAGWLFLCCDGVVAIGDWLLMFMAEWFGVILVVYMVNIA